MHLTIRIRPSRVSPRDRWSRGGSLCRRSLFGLALLATFRVATGAAQGLSPTSLDVTAGAGAGSRPGPYDSGLGWSADALLGFRPGARARAGGGFILGISASGQGFNGGISCDAVPGQPCDPGFPAFRLVSTLAGWETGTGGVRLLLGPALARSQGEFAGAAHARLDLAPPISRHLSLLASGRVTYIPRHRGESFSLGFVGLGVRLQ